MATSRNVLQSLKAGATAAERRCYADVIAASPAFNPTLPHLATSYSTGSNQNLHVTIELPEADSSIIWTLYTWSPAAQLWRVHPTAVGETVFKAESPDASEIGINGVARVLILFASPVNIGAGANVWLEVNSF